MQMNNPTIEGGKEEKKSMDGELLSSSTPLSIEILRKETFLESENVNHLTRLKEKHKIVFKNEDTKREEKTVKEDLSHSEAGFTKLGVEKSERSFIFAFIDETIDYILKSRMKRKSHSVLLGDGRYKVKKLFFDSEITVFSLLQSLLGFNFDLSYFMKRYKVSQVTGFVIHPLAKVADLVCIDNHMIISKRKDDNLGFDKSLRRSTRIFGLENLGNTCFMNSALQCILACEEFADFFVVLNKSLFDLSKMPLTKSILSLVNAGEKYLRIIAPVDVKHSLGYKRSMYLEIKEQDAVEFINDLFDVIHEEFINLSGKRYVKFYTTATQTIINQKIVLKSDEKIDLESDIEHIYKCKINDNEDYERLKGLADSIVSSQGLDIPERTYNNWLNSNRSIITDLFFSKMKSSIVCTNCKNTRVVYEPNLVHSVPVPGETFYFENIILFYESPEKVPLRIFARSEMSIEELMNCLYADYDFHYNVVFILTDVNGSNTIVPPQTILSTLIGTLYCYEYKQDAINSYYWVTIFVKSIWLSYNFDFNFLIRLENLNEKNLFDVLKCRLTPFLEDKIVFLFYENIEQFFTVTIKNRGIETNNIINRPFIRVEISNYNYKRLFGKGFRSTDRIIQLLSRPVTLSDCINLFLEKEFIFGHEKKLCESCQNYSVFYKKLDFVEFPKYLIVQLKRFTFNGKTFEKLNTFVDFPTDFILIQGVKYSIVSISNHISSSSLKNIGSNGHYTAYVKKDVWYYCNDQNVGPITDSIDKKNAYIFFLERNT